MLAFQSTRWNRATREVRSAHLSDSRVGHVALTKAGFSFCSGHPGVWVPSWPRDEVNCWNWLMYQPVEVKCSVKSCYFHRRIYKYSRLTKFNCRESNLDSFCNLRRPNSMTLTASVIFSKPESDAKFREGSERMQTTSCRSTLPLSLPSPTRTGSATRCSSSNSRSILSGRLLYSAESSRVRVSTVLRVLMFVPNGTTPSYFLR